MKQFHPSQPVLTIGPWLELSSGTDGISGVQDRDSEILEQARFLLKGTQRPPYAIPERV